MYKVVKVVIGHVSILGLVAMVLILAATSARGQCDPPPLFPSEVSVTLNYDTQLPGSVLKPCHASIVVSGVGTFNIDPGYYSKIITVPHGWMGTITVTESNVAWTTSNGTNTHNQLYPICGFTEVVYFDGIWDNYTARVTVNVDGVPTDGIQFSFTGAGRDCQDSWDYIPPTSTCCGGTHLFEDKFPHGWRGDINLLNVDPCYDYTVSTFGPITYGTYSNPYPITVNLTTRSITVAGEVTDENGTVIIGAIVHVTPGTDVTTDANGYVATVSCGTVLQPEYPGYYFAPQTITTTAPGAVGPDFAGVRLVEVTSPVGGETWAPGTQQTITWNACGVCPITSQEV